MCQLPVFIIPDNNRVNLNTESQYVSQCVLLSYSDFDDTYFDSSQDSRNYIQQFCPATTAALTVRKIEKTTQQMLKN